MNQVCSRDPFDGEAGGRVGAPTTITTKLILPAYPIDFFSPFLGYGLPAFNCSQARRQAGKRPLASACPPTTVAAGPPAHSSVPRIFLLSNQCGSRSVDKSRIYHFYFPLILMRLAALVVLSPPHHNNLFLCSFAVCLKLWHVSKKRWKHHVAKKQNLCQAFGTTSWKTLEGFWLTWCSETSWYGVCSILDPLRLKNQWGKDPGPALDKDLHMKRVENQPKPINADKHRRRWVGGLGVEWWITTCIGYSPLNGF